MIHFGDLHGAKKPIGDLRNILSDVAKGSFTWDVPGKSDYKIILPNATVQVFFPFRMDYELKGDTMILKFSKPYPIGNYKIFSKFIESATVHGVEQIEVELLRSPNGYFNLKD